MLTIANDAINAAKIAANAVGSSEIADNAVSKAKMQDDSVGEAEIKSDENLTFAGHVVLARALSGTSITEKSAVQVNGYDSSTGQATIKHCQAPGEAMGIALESTSANHSGESIKVMIRGVTTAKIFSSGNAMSAGDKLAPYTTNPGEVQKAMSPEVGGVVGWLLEAVGAGESSALDKKIWVQPC